MRDIHAGGWDPRILATVPPELRHEVITDPAPAATGPDSDPPRASARRKAKAPSVVPDSASEREESVGTVKDEDEDPGKRGARRARGRPARRGREDDDEEDRTSDAQDEQDTDRELSVPSAGKKSTRTRKSIAAATSQTKSARPPSLC